MRVLKKYGLLSTADECVDEIFYGFAIYCCMRVLMKYVMGLLSAADEGVAENMLWCTIYC